MTKLYSNEMKKGYRVKYDVKYDVKYKEGTITARDSGVYEEWYWVIRENSNSPWVIDDAGV
ncbi:DUF4829 domain-containing protein [Clostridium sp. UBA6640]|uniref:DUF4829 domain-containing protein n=1 Tax=Clostridium sp. UBA6640 TaxID=1946370 RepID=UPI0025C2DA54|nr:DUF4829 domain-containing protein [Clostridium sp. UBA6640]